VPEYLTPGVYFEFRDTAPPLVRRVRSDVTGFIGLAERGPLHQAVQIDSWRNFQAVFGDFVPYGFLAYAVKGFFENGGQACFVVRVASPPAATATLKLKNAHQQELLTLRSRRAGKSGNQISIVLTSGSKPNTFSLRVIPSENNALEQEDFTDLVIQSPDNQVCYPRLQYQSTGQEVRSRWVDFQFPEALPQGDLLPTAEASGLQAGKKKLDNGQDGSAKATLSLKNGCRQEVLQIWATEGSWGNQVEIALIPDSKPSWFPNRLIPFSLRINRRGLEPEYLNNLVIKPSENGAPSRLIQIVRQNEEQDVRSRWVDFKLPENLPNDLLPNPDASELQRGVHFLTGGQDGLSSLTPDDFLGYSDPVNPVRKGLSALDLVDSIGIVCIPDLHIRPVDVLKAPPVRIPQQDPCRCQAASILLDATSHAVTDVSFPEQPPGFSKEQVSRVQQALIEHCERQKYRIAILDAPLADLDTPLVEGKDLTPDGILERRSQSQLATDRGFAALYYPWIKVVDPLKLGGSPVRSIPPSGHIAGLYARTDFTVGVHKAPANAELVWAEDVTVQLNEAEQGILNPVGVNCLRAFPGRGIRVFGARTLSSDPSWRFVNVRRLLSMIEKAVDESTQWSVFEPNNYTLRQLVVLSISSFLNSIWQQGALVGETAEDAYFVKCDESNNPPEVVDLGQLIADVGVKPALPAEFIVFRIGRTAEELEIVER
jgi:uncharacterized protein